MTSYTRIERAATVEEAMADIERKSAETVRNAREALEQALGRPSAEEAPEPAEAEEAVLCDFCEATVPESRTTVGRYEDDWFTYCDRCRGSINEPRRD